jgi:hypothetical protein
MTLTEVCLKTVLSISAWAIFSWVVMRLPFWRL